MENKSANIYIKTSKGEDEAHGKTSHLAGDVRRALLMVNGTSTFEEISKRAAPSLRSSLNELFEGLEKSGYIQHQQHKDKTGNSPRIAVQPKMAMPAGMVVPAKTGTPQANQDDAGEELDFMSGFSNKPAKVEETKGFSVREIEEKSRQDVEAGKIQTQQAVEAMRLMIEQEMERLRSGTTAQVNDGAALQARASTEAKEKQEADAARLKAENEAKAHAEARAKQEIEAAKVKLEAEAARFKAESEARVRAEAMAMQEAEAARMKLEQEAEAVRIKAESEARARAEAMARQEIEAARLKLEQEAEAARIKAESEVRARAEAMARQEIEAARLKLEQEAEAVRIKAESEVRARAEAMARQEIEAAKMKMEQEAEAARIKAESEARVLAEAIAKQEIEAAKLKLQQEAEAIRLKAEQEAEAARLKVEIEARVLAEAIARQEAEAARLKQEQEAAAAHSTSDNQVKALAEAMVRQEIEAARLKAQQEANAAKFKVESEARALAEAMARQEIEAAKLKLQREAEDARLKAEQQAAKAREEAAANLKARQRAEAMLIKSVQNTAQAKAQGTSGQRDVTMTTRTTIATVLFFDVVGYTKQSVSKQIEIKKQFNDLVSECLKVAVDGERIILDTGDGAAIGFLNHPEDALEVANKFRKTVVANEHRDYPELKVRIGIHLGPINIAKDMNGRSNIVGDGINDAQRVMGFAGVDQIFISRPYHDFVSRLKDEYALKLQYRGMQADKHGREHPVYEFTESAAPAVEVQPNPFATFSTTAQAGKSGAFAFDSFQVGEQQPLGGSAGGGQPGQTPAATGTSGFAFDSFQVDVPKPQGAQQPSRSTAANIPAPAGEQAVSSRGKSAHQSRLATEQHIAAEADAKKRAEEHAASEARKLAEQRAAAEAEAKKLAEQRAAEEAEAKRMADEQAQVWAEAEQRSIESAKANAARATHHTEHHPVESTASASAASITRNKRKSSFSLMWLAGFLFKLSLFLWVLLVAALFAVPYFLPMRDYMPKVQEMISARLHQPVHLGYLSGRMLPTPRLELGEIYIGDAKQFQASQAYLNFSLYGLFGDVKPIDSIDFQGVKIRGMGLQKASLWLQELASYPEYPVARMTISQGKLDAEAFELSGIEGDVDFDPTGKFTQAKLHGNSGKYTMGFTAVTGNKLLVTIAVHGGELPLLPNWTFDELTAKGELNNAGLTIYNFDAQLLGGTMQGNASISWNSGWSAQGVMTGKKISMGKLDHLLEGNLDGEGHFKMSSANLAGLTESATFDGNFRANDGMISGMDIIETARRRSKEHLPGGRTPFDELTGMVSYTDNAYHFKQTKITAKVLNATATFEVAKQQVSGKMNVNLSIQDGSGTADLQIGGTPDSPTLRYAP